ncbi:MAG: tetratricopeptide repeat protein, partial [Cyanobacteria bacterium P01_D01_bin.36]
RARARVATNNVPDALADYESAIGLNPVDGSVYKGRADAYAIYGDLPAAIADYTYAIELDDSFSEAYASRGRAYYEAGDAQSAYQDFSHIISKDPAANADIYYYRGITLVALGDTFGAHSDLQAAADRYLANGEADGYRAVLERMSRL